MKARQTQNTRGYKLSFIINTIVGGFMILLAVAGAVLDFPMFHGGLPLSLLMTGAICMSIGYVHHRIYLNLIK
jgi:hypothetical protein